MRLAWPAAADRASVRRMAEAILLVRRLVTTPAEDMGPDQIADAARGIAARHGARFRLVRGDALLAENYPMIHAVGRASARPPLLADLRWGPEDAPRLGIVGKGVVFDTGGLDLKPAAGMALMKKDMGGAAHALALAGMVMDAGLNVRLRLLLPCVENAVSGSAFRPGDVLASRRGLSVEIGNTDAEGRLILADALADAGDEAPDLLLDFATLTGAARIALGPDLPAMFCNDDSLAQEVDSKKLVAVMLTGMGTDGAQAMKRLHDAGVPGLAQDESSSVVWGMPKAVVDLGAADQVLPLRKMAEAMLKEAR